MFASDCHFFASSVKYVNAFEKHSNATIRELIYFGTRILHRRIGEFGKLITARDFDLKLMNIVISVSKLRVPIFLWSTLLTPASHIQIYRANDWVSLSQLASVG